MTYISLQSFWCSHVSKGGKIGRQATDVVRNESAGIQFEPDDVTNVNSRICKNQYRRQTTTEYSNIIDFEEKAKAFLINQCVLNHTGTTESDFF
jgi:hypothetical protein